MQSPTIELSVGVIAFAGELFPGPHLYGGMAITILWAGKPSIPHAC